MLGYSRRATSNKNALIQLQDPGGKPRGASPVADKQHWTGAVGWRRRRQHVIDLEVAVRRERDRSRGAEQRRSRRRVATQRRQDALVGVQADVVAAAE